MVSNVELSFFHVAFHCFRFWLFLHFFFSFLFMTLIRFWALNMCRVILYMTVSAYDFRRREHACLDVSLSFTRSRRRNVWHLHVRMCMANTFHSNFFQRKKNMLTEVNDGIPHIVISDFFYLFTNLCFLLLFSLSHSQGCYHAGKYWILW